MKLNCPNCNSEIDNSKINVSTDLAQCSNCNSIHKLSELVESDNLDEIGNPPKGSKISFQKIDDQIEIELPKKGFKVAQIGMLIFPLFWLGFISFWTWGAAQGSIVFALFSIPFWIVGIFMVIGILNTFLEKQKLKVGKSILVLEKKKIENDTSIEYTFDEIFSIDKQQVKMNGFGFGNFKHFFRNPAQFQQGLKYPAISTGTDTEFFFENASNAEQEWIIKFLNSWTKHHKRT